MRGRRPVPHTLKLLRGTGRHQRGRVEPVPRGVLERPADLSEAARIEWDRLVAAAPAGLLTSADQTTLRCYVEACVLCSIAVKRIETEGMVIQGPRGRPTISPWARLLLRQIELQIRLAEQLGFTPMSRSRLRVAAPPPPDDEYMKYVKGRDRHDERQEQTDPTKPA